MSGGGNVIRCREGTHDAVSGGGNVMRCQEGTRDTVSGRLGEGVDRVLGDGNKTFYKRNY